jgi:ferredoxin
MRVGVLPKLIALGVLPITPKSCRPIPLSVRPRRRPGFFGADRPNEKDGAGPARALRPSSVLHIGLVFLRGRWRERGLERVSNLPPYMLRQHASPIYPRFGSTLGSTAPQLQSDPRAACTAICSCSTCHVGSDGTFPAVPASAEHIPSRAWIGCRIGPRPFVVSCGGRPPAPSDDLAGERASPTGLRLPTVTVDPDSLQNRLKRDAMLANVDDPVEASRRRAHRPARHDYEWQ